MSQIIDVNISNCNSQSNFGHSIDVLPDLDHDGCDELIIGAPGENKTYIFSGSTIKEDSDSELNSSNDAALILKGETNGNLGISVAAAINLDGDMYSDLIVGDSNSDKASL